MRIRVPPLWRCYYSDWKLGVGLRHSQDGSSFQAFCMSRWRFAVKLLWKRNKAETKRPGEHSVRRAEAWQHYVYTYIYIYMYYSGGPPLRRWRELTCQKVPPGAPPISLDIAPSPGSLSDPMAVTPRGERGDASASRPHPRLLPPGLGRQ